MSRAAESRLATSYARLREHLAYLGLATAAEQLAPELERAKMRTFTGPSVLVVDELGYLPMDADFGALDLPGRVAPL